MEMELLRYISIKNGLGLSYISKDERLSNILSQIWDIMGEKVILKGGTALNRVYLSKINASRFSEDIDLDYISEEPLDVKIKEIKNSVNEIKGFNIKGPRILHRTLRFDCYYNNELDKKDVVRLEFYLNKSPFREARIELVKSPFIDSYPTMFKVYSLEDLIAKKLIAFYNRGEGKDIYDLFFSFQMDIDREKLMDTLNINIEFYNIVDFFKGLMRQINLAKQEAWYIGNSTNHFIPKSLRPNWVELIETLEGDLSKRFKEI